MPAVLSWKVERSIVRWPPASIAVRAMTLCSAVSRSKTVLQLAQAPMWKAESAMLEAKLRVISPGPRVSETKMPSRAGARREAKVEVTVR